MEDSKDGKKIVIVGDPRCGKSSLVQVFETGVFSEHIYPSVHNQSPKSKQVLVIPGQIPVRLILWDVDVSSPEYEHLRPQLYRDADVVLICFALDDFESLTNVVDKWHPDVLKYAGKSVPVNLVGLKQDLRDRQVGDGGVSYDEGVAISKQLDVKGYFECSARLNTGVDEVFQFTARFVCDWNEGKRKCTIL